MTGIHEIQIGCCCCSVILIRKFCSTYQWCISVSVQHDMIYDVIPADFCIKHIIQKCMLLIAVFMVEYDTTLPLSK